MELEDQYSPVERILGKLTEQSVKKYKELMLSVVDSKQPFTVKQLQEHHEVLKNQLLKDFEEISASLLLGFPEASNIVDASMGKLKSKLDSEMSTMLRKYEVTIEKVMSQIKQCTLHAENHYDDLMLQFIPSEATYAEIQDKHNEMRQQALKQFEENIKMENLVMHEEWVTELNQKLEDKLQEMLSECKTDPTFKNTGENIYISPTELDNWISTLNFQTGYFNTTNTVICGSNCPSGKECGNSGANLLENSTSCNENTTRSLNNYSRNPSLQNSMTNSIGNSPTLVVQTNQSQEPVKTMESEATFLPPSEICDIGIYLDKRIVSVGWISPKSGGFQNILTTTAEVAFLENGVLIGEEAAKFANQPNHILIAHAIGDKTRHEIFKPRMFQQQLSSENVLHVFFKKLSTDVLSSTGCQYVRNVVISIPHATTCNERRRIKTTARRIFENVRVLSSLLTTAAFYAAHEQYYCNDIQNPEYIFVAQSLRTEFTMAAVEIGPGGILTKNVVSSKNFKEGASYDFLDSHARIFEGVELSIEKVQRIRKLYSQAGKQLMDQTLHGRNNETLFVINPPESKFNDFYRNIFPQRFHTNFNIQNGPLQGACVLADDRSLRPPQICDRSRTFFSLSFCPGLNQLSGDCKFQELVDFNKQPFRSRSMAFPSAVISQNAHFLLGENFCPTLTSVEVDHYYFTIERATYIIVINCDDDGILSLIANPI